MTAAMLPDEGPLTIAELQMIWESAVDPLYAQPLKDKGDGSGLEVFGQTFAQLARVSMAVDVSTQAMFILPWSGQTDAPAQGAANARVLLTVTRTKRLELPMVMGAGVVLVEEQTTDWGLDPGDGPQTVLTGRRYRLVQNLVFPPGVAGPLTIEAEAERPGWGYNNPRPGTVSVVSQPGVDYTNVGASVVPSGPSTLLVAAGVPDVFIPEHVGQYVLATAGANVGTIMRAIGYAGPVGTDGGRLLVEREISFWGTPTGTFVAGETVRQSTTLAEGVVLGTAAAYLLISPRSGTFDGLHGLTGLSSGATFAPNSIVRDNALVPETNTLGWRLYGWVDDWGVVVTHELSPSGGRLGFLDELGHERNLPRGPAEGDDQYRDRISKPADVVSPGALMRAANRVLTPLGLSGCFREAGQLSLPGFYLDAQDRWDEGAVRVVPANAVAFQPGEELRQLDPTTGQIAYGRALMVYSAPPTLVMKLDAIAVKGGTFQTGLLIVGQTSGASFTPGGGTLVQDISDPRYRYLFDFLEMRAFFIEAVPRVNFGEFGFAFDADPRGFFDSYPYATFFDGYPAGAAAFYRTVWIAQENVKAGGVGHDVVLDGGPCP